MKSNPLPGAGSAMAFNAIGDRAALPSPAASTAASSALPAVHAAPVEVTDGPLLMLFSALLEASTKISFHTSGNKSLRRKEAACD